MSEGRSPGNRPEILTLARRMAERRLQVFYAVAKQLSFTRAADILYMTQPAVTFQVKQLEEHFNTRLFERSHGKIALTPAGNVVLDYAERILGLSAELETRMGELTGEVGGLLMLGASTTIADYILPRTLGEFKRHYQQVQPRLMVGNSEAIEKAVAEHALDVGLIESPAHQPNLHTEVCSEDELVVIVAPDHELAKRASVTPVELAQFPFISREPGSGTKEFTDGYFQRAGVAPEELDVVMELGSPEAVKGVVASGLGFAVMSRATVAQELRLGTLAALPLQPRLIRILSLVYPREKFRSRLLNVFVDFALSRLKAPRE